jgi:PKD repeat protein
MQTLKIGLLFILFGFNLSAFSQMSGTYTIGGTSPDFADANNAIDNINRNGVNGPVTLAFRPGIYTAFIDYRNLNYLYPITFTSSNGIADSVQVTISNLVNCKNVYFKKLIIYPLENTGYQYNYKGMELSNSEDIGFDSCIFIGQNKPTYKEGLTITNVVNIYVKHCQFRNLDNAVVFSDYMSSSGYYRRYGKSIIDSCQFDSVNVAIRMLGAYSGGIGDSVVIHGNVVRDCQYGIYLDATNAGYDQTHIAITDNQFLHTLGLYMYNANLKYSTVYIFNNRFVCSQQGIQPPYIWGYGGRAVMAFANCDSVRLYSNSTIGAVYLESSTAILRNNSLTDTSKAVFVVSRNSFYKNDYNNYYAPHAPFLISVSNTNYSSLDSARLALGGDVHSISKPPYYYGPLNLHSHSPYMQFSASPGSNISDDIDRESRSLSHPDIGADEYQASPLPPFAHFDYSCTGTNAVVFINNSVRGASYYWNFGDGTNSTATAPTHTFASGVNNVVGLKVTNAYGVDSFMTIVLTPSPPVVVAHGDSLYTTGTYSVYQWNLNGYPIPGATQPYYIVLFNGAYSLSAGSDTAVCRSTSSDFQYLGIRENEADYFVTLSPNPASGFVTITLKEPGVTHLELINTLGQVLWQQESVDRIARVNGLPAGLYFLRISVQGHLYSKKLEVL